MEIGRRVKRPTDSMEGLTAELFRGGELNLKNSAAIRNLYAAYCLEYASQPLDNLAGDSPLSLPGFLLIFSRALEREPVESIEDLVHLVHSIGPIGNKGTKSLNFQEPDYRRWKTLFGDEIFKAQVSGGYLPTIEDMAKREGYAAPHEPFLRTEFAYIDEDRTISLTIGELLTLFDDSVLDQRFIDVDSLERFIYKKQ